MGTGDKDVLRHPGTEEVPAWVKLDPIAARPARVAAMEVLNAQVRIQFHGKDSSNPHSVVIYARDVNHVRGERIFGGTGTKVNPAVLDFDTRLVDREGRQGKTWSITLAPSATTAARLDLAADLLKQGHDVTLFVRDDALHIYFSTENCRCVNCNHQ